VVFTREPSSLKISGSVDLWAIDNRPYTANTGRLWIFTDCFGVGPQVVSPPNRELLLAAPILTAPAANFIIPIDQDKGTIADITFKWRHPTQARKYELLLAKDRGFSQLVTRQSIIPESPVMPTWTLSSKEISLEPGVTYYWKVRVTRDATSEPAEGQWSEIMSFSIAAAPEKQPAAPSPGLLTPANGDTKTVVSEPAKQKVEPAAKPQEIPWKANTITLLWIAIPLLIVIIAIIWIAAARSRPRL
jgi:hypothetical protein